MNSWECKECNFVYNESKGLEKEGIAPGTKWENIPNDWICPDCGSGKSRFIKL